MIVRFHLFNCDTEDYDENVLLLAQIEGDMAPFFNNYIQNKDMTNVQLMKVKFTTVVSQTEVDNTLFCMNRRSGAVEWRQVNPNFKDIHDDAKFNFANSLIEPRPPPPIPTTPVNIPRPVNPIPTTTIPLFPVTKGILPTIAVPKEESGVQTQILKFVGIGAGVLALVIVAAVLFARRRKIFKKRTRRHHGERRRSRSPRSETTRR